MSQHRKPLLLASRRRFIQRSALTVGGLAAGGVLGPRLFSIASAASARPQLPLGVASGDVASDGAVVRARPIARRG